jgi:hypothetical protein
MARSAASAALSCARELSSSSLGGHLFFIIESSLLPGFSIFGGTPDVPTGQGTHAEPLCLQSLYNCMTTSRQPLATAAEKCNCCSTANAPGLGYTALFLERRP